MLQDMTKLLFDTDRLIKFMPIVPGDSLAAQVSMTSNLLFH